MMRLLICVCLAGAAAYALIPTNEEPEWGTGAKVATAKPKPISQGERKLRSSWGSTLQSLGRDSASLAAVSRHSDTSSPPQQQAAYWPGRAGANQASEQPPDAGVAPAAQAPARSTPAAAEHVTWARLILGAKAHRAASVSSPITRFYPTGTELQIVGRESGWLELQDPVTQERGFVFEKYLAAIDGPSPTQPVTQASAAPRPPKAVSKTASQKARSARQATKPVQQAANEPQVTLSDARRDGLTKKVERRERKMFRWFGGRDPRAAAWTVGPPR